MAKVERIYLTNSGKYVIIFGEGWKLDMNEKGARWVDKIIEGDCLEIMTKWRNGEMEKWLLNPQL